MSQPTIEKGWQIIVPSEHERFKPKLPTDEWWLESRGLWIGTILPDGVFYHGRTYRRIATPSANDRVREMIEGRLKGQGKGTHKEFLKELLRVLEGEK